MRIMFYTSSLGKGGAERVISILSNELIKNNSICIVVNTRKNISYEIKNNIKIIELDKKYIKSNLLRNLNRIKITKNVIEKEKPDIIISFLPIPSYRVLSLRKKNKIPLIVSDRNNPEQEYKSFINKILMNRLYPRADGFVFQTEKQKKYFSEEIQAKSTVIHNPLKEEFLEEKAEKQKENTIISVGRLVEQKNQEMLIEAFSAIAIENKEYVLKIFGEGPLRKKLQSKIDDLNLQERISLCGVSDNIREELEKAKMFVLSSNYEGMPNALIEAMAVGLPVICTDCPCGRT